MAFGVAISAPLWLTGRTFPRTSIWEPLATLALTPPLDVFLLVVFLVTLGLAAVSGRRILFAACFLFALVLAAPDMQRWQPWFFQYAFMIGALAFRRESEDALGGLSVIVAFTYAYSGLQKVHAAFFEGGMEFFLEPFGLAERLVGLSYAAPFIEIAVGVGLLFAPTRSFAALVAVGMHAFLLVALGPLGQDWNVVVWPWNVSMMAFVLILFFRAPGCSFLTLRSVYGRLVVVLFVVMPAFGLFGLWPSYLSASLYSGNTKSALVYDGEEYVSVSSLSTSEFETPAYPEEAVFMNVAGRACERYEDELSERPVMQVSSRPDAFTGERDDRLYRCPDLVP